MSADRASAAIERARRVLAAGARLRDGADPLGAEARARLPAAAGLSPEGAHLALTEHLEVDASAAELAALVASVTAAPRTWVVAAANVCTAPLRAIALGLAASPRVLVRPSRRDPVVAELLVRALREDPALGELGGSIELAPELAPARGDRVHAYGSDATMRDIARDLPAGVELDAHGTGFGVAVMDLERPPAEQAAAIARDVVPFDQRGCLSPRVVLAPDDERASALGHALHAELTAAEGRIPRGPLDPATAGELSAFLASLEAVGDVLRGAAHAVALDPAPRALALPPAARAVAIAVTSPSDVARLLGPVAPHVAALGGAGPLADAAARLAPGARRSPLGEMQRPPLDGPVDLRGLTRR